MSSRQAKHLKKLQQEAMSSVELHMPDQSLLWTLLTEASATGCGAHSRDWSGICSSTELLASCCLVMLVSPHRKALSCSVFRFVIRKSYKRQDKRVEKASIKTELNAETDKWTAMKVCANMLEHYSIDSRVM